MHKKFNPVFILMVLLWQAAAWAEEPEWVKKSNAIAYKILESGAKFAPEFAGQTGVDGYDEAIFDLRDDLVKRQLQNAEDNLAMLNKELAKATDPRVKQDIEIMIQSVKDNIEATKINDAKVLPYGNVVGLIFAGFNGLLDKQVPFERQQAALVRLKKYNGTAKGYEPLVELAKERLTERMGEKDLIKPYRGEVEQDIQRSTIFIDGLSQVFGQTDLSGYEADLQLLQDQLKDYNEWVKANILPNTRESAVLPRELYELQLKNYGVDASPEELMVIGQNAFMNIRFEMMALAPLVAEKMGYETNDYREVMELLKDDQVHGDALMEEYAAVMRALDQIIEKHELISLPNEPARARMATAAETAQQPAAHLDVPRLVGNTGEFPEFIVPRIEPNEDGSWPKNDYAFKAMMWTLSAHEARPGHELQFTTMLRGGVSTARALFAFNSANVEGWALYAEAISKQYMPLEGQLYSLQARLLRAARIWLDPMLNLGLITPAEAKRILMEDVGEDDLNAQTEIDRYTFRSPAQATAYYYGYEKLLQLRAKTELKLKDQFVQKDFHDFILQQGLLPPDLLGKAVEENFIAPQLKN
ncbi:DUF885 domain-containing protein [Marinicella meishanensis]|uniref:DUF885 domain-containing protein n=1 Tax=Marinicella meishanensis TaxID=2873263 RepID=UPI001CBFF7E1|nr:DUF885 domain-containing protein [Marinicella sp. NBU2979]